MNFKLNDAELTIIYNRLSIPTRAFSHYFSEDMHPEDYFSMPAYDKIEAEMERRGLL